jgi:predicted Zn-dependent peptidase
MLDNGLKLVTMPMDNMESVSIGVWIRAGGRYENAKLNGISHLLEHILFKGTTRRDMKTIKQEIEGRGGSFNGFTSEEHTCYLVKVLSKDAELGIDILSDMVTNPKMAPEEIRKEKGVIIEEINMYKDIPAHYVHEILAEMMWPGQPLGFPLAGTVESVMSLTRQSLLKYKETYYTPGNMILACAGNIDEDKLRALCTRYFPGEKADKERGFDKISLSQKKPMLKLHTKKTEQTHVALGIHTIDRFHPDRHVLSLINIILGANMSSRLFHIVRDEMALCYEISSTVRRYEDCGAFLISSGVDDKKLLKALEVILRETSRIKKEPVPAEELIRAKEFYKGQLLFALEDTMNHMLWLGEKVISGEKDFSVRDIMARIDSVKADDIMRVARAAFKDENLNMAVIGPVTGEKKIREVLHFK